MVILEGYIQVPLGELAAVEEELERHIELTRQESGCLVFNVVKNSDIPGRFEVYEEFASEAAFVAHQARVEASRWGEMSRNVQREYKIKRS